MYPQSFRSLKEITTCFPCFFCFLLFLKSVQLVYKSSTLLQPFRCGKAFVKERALKRRSLAKALIWDDLSRCDSAQIDFCPGWSVSLILQKIREEIWFETKARQQCQIGTHQATKPINKPVRNISRSGERQSVNFWRWGLFMASTHIQPQTELLLRCWIQASFSKFLELPSWATHCVHKALGLFKPSFALCKICDCPSNKYAEHTWSYHDIFSYISIDLPLGVWHNFRL